MRRIELQTIGTVGKGITAKREKQEDDTEATIVHLKFSGLFVTREQIDALLGKDEGWSQRTLYDETGAPVLWCVLTPLRFECSVTGSLKPSADSDEGLRLIDATLTKIDVTLTNVGGYVAGQLSWKAAGDEVSDAEALLGQTVQANLAFYDAGQQDLFSEAA